jgi:hypothetical protein
MIRLLRIEARHSATPWVLPLLAVLLGITPLARNLTPVALWLDRSVDVAGSVQLVGPFAAGTAAWMASRARRRGMGELLASTPREAWGRVFATWLGSAGWIVAFYVGLCVVFFSLTAGQATWGSLLWWPVVVGLVSTVACSAVGFFVGLRIPSRFTTPLVALGVLAAILGTRSAAAGAHPLGIGLLSPIYPTFGLDASVFYRPLPDLGILQFLLYTGILVLAAGAMGWRKRIGATLMVVGVGLAATAGVLVTQVRFEGPSIVVFHSASEAVPYTPVCSDAPLPVCVHPAYTGGHELSVLSTIINDIARPVLGIPGMPVRASQTAGDHTFGVRGDPPTLPFTNFIVHGTTLQPAQFDRIFRADVALSLFVGPQTAPRQATTVQRALALYLVRQSDSTADPGLLSTEDPRVTSAASRFAALTSEARTTWLSTHLTAVRAGQSTLPEIP